MTPPQRPSASPAAWLIRRLWPSGGRQRGDVHRVVGGEPAPAGEGPADEEPDTLVDVCAGEIIETPADPDGLGARRAPSRAMVEELLSIDRLLGFEPLCDWWRRARMSDDLIGSIRGDERRKEQDR